MCADKENITRKKIKLNASLQFSTITNPPTTIEHGKQRKQFNVYEQHPTKKQKVTPFIGSPCMAPMQGKHKLDSPL